MIVPIINQPRACRVALETTRSPVVLDVETSGLTRHDIIVSAGLLIDGAAHILFVRSKIIPCISDHALHYALVPLSLRRDLVIVGHNIAFDIGMLAREGIRVIGSIYDTEKLLRLVDPDRGKNKDVLSSRVDRAVPRGSPDRLLNYKLKNVVPQLLGLRMVGYDNSTPMANLPYHSHVLYLTSDLLGTKSLYDFLISQLSPGEKVYHDRLISPLTPILVRMMETGIRLDPAFIRSETIVLQELMQNLSSKHQSVYGCSLGSMNDRQAISWLFGSLGLVPIDRKKRTPGQIRLGIRMGDPSLKDSHLEVLVTLYAENPRVVGSLKLIRAYRQLSWLKNNLQTFIPHLDYRDGRVHTSLRDTLATGRISSKDPNLQGIPRSKDIADITIRPRNVLRASDGYELVTFDIAQADIRVMAHAVDSQKLSGVQHLAHLRAERYNILAPFIAPHLVQLKAHRNPAYKFKPFGGVDEPNFNPKENDDLGRILTGTGDLYRMVARQVTGQSHIDGPTRDVFKTTVLSLANSITPSGLARRLGYSTDKEGVARNLIVNFWKAFPKVRSYLDLMEWVVALTGTTCTWAGRTRTCSAHHWMCTSPRVEIKISYKGDSWYWLDVIPLRPGRHVITVWVRKVWDATFRSSNYGSLIYEDTKGVIPVIHSYRLFQDHPPLMYVLPIRNIAWRSIRRVRTDTEEATYYGFDTTARSLLNFVFQAGTADVAKQMMIRCIPYCNWIGARLLLNIHDELLFEVPELRVMEFIRTMKRLLELPPDSSWTIPIRVEAKHGCSFGEMKKLERPAQ